MGATYITVANNIIQGGGPASTISGPNTNATWTDNILFNTTGAGDMPAGSYKNIDPKLVKDSNGEYHLLKGSPAVNAATGKFPSLTVDMDGQQRTSPLDVGADEVSNAKVAAHILKAPDVGAATGSK